MKNTIKVALCALMIFAGSQFAHAQKLGYINTNEVFGLMPERDSASVKFEAYARDQAEVLELMEVEYRTKQDEMTKNLSTWSQAQAQAAQESLQSLLVRIQEKDQQVQQDLQNRQNELLAPIMARFNEALKKVSQVAGVVAVFDIGTMNYYDPNAMTDMAPLVKKELGIQ
jgi:outer membrane protein